MRRETEKYIGVPIGISDWRQVYPAIHREFAMEEDVQEILDKIYAKRPNPEAEEPSSDAITRARQAGHSRQTEESIYGRLLKQSPFSTTAEKEAFRKVSVDWHRFLQFPSAYQEPHMHPDVRERIRQDQEQKRLYRQRQMREIDVEAALRQLYHNPQATFRGQQREALDLIVSGHPRPVIIMRTGVGRVCCSCCPPPHPKEGPPSSSSQRRHYRPICSSVATMPG